MAIVRDGMVIRQLRTLYHIGALGSLTDGQLLERFATERGESSELAFAALVERHGTMVLRVCRAILRDEHEAQDAFQATFFVLAKRPGSLWVSESLGPWLYGVARRVASCARSALVRRRRLERTAAGLTPRWVEESHDGDLEPRLHEEIARLPERWRVPVVLCLVEGFTHEQAARHLGWPVGTVKSRLAQGREQLRGRLVRRGLAPAAALSATVLATHSVRAATPAALVHATAQAAVRLVTGKAAAGAVPAAAASLAASVLRRRLMLRLSLTTAAILALGLIGVSSPLAGQAVSGVKYTFVDLQPRGNHKLNEPLGSLDGNNLAELPRGVQKLGCTPFLIGEQLIRVRGRNAPEPPACVSGIAVGARFDRLLILHSTMFGNGFGVEDGTEIGSYVLHYADHSTMRIPILYGADLRDWWRDSDPAETSRARLAWAGKNQASSVEGDIRLFVLEWKNPYPDKRVATIDFETRDTPCAPFVVALTIEETL